jgi:hypothetical protein
LRDAIVIPAKAAIQIARAGESKNLSWRIWARLDSRFRGNDMIDRFCE